MFTFHGRGQSSVVHDEAKQSPGPDGFTAGFYQKHWDLLRTDVCNATLEFLNGGHMPNEVNDTTLFLIPKVDAGY